MNKALPLVVVTAIMFYFGSAMSQPSIDAGAWTEFYVYKVQQPADETQARSLQGARLRIRNAFVPGLSIFFRGRVASDISNKLATDPDFRVFGAYIEYMRSDFATLRLGRQFISAGLGGFTVDGGRIDLTYQNSVILTGFAGAAPGPSFHEYDVVGQWDDRNAFGGRLQFAGIKGFRLATSYQQRNKNDETDTQLAGADFAVNSGPFTERGRFDYDFINDRLKMVVLRTGARFQQRHSLDFEYLYRRPTFAASDLFWVFRSEPFHQVRLSPVYRINQDLFAQGSLSYTILDEEQNTRISAGASYKGQSAGFVFSNGYGGIRLGAYGYLFRDLRQDLQLYIAGNLFNYKLDTEEEDTTPSVSTAVGARFDIIRGLNSRAELQFLSNRDFEYDTKFYVRLGYEFKTNLSAGRPEGGSSQ
jgi:hypothetical protein